MQRLSFPAHTHLSHSPASIKFPNIAYKCRSKAVHFSERKESVCRVTINYFSETMTIMKQGVQLDVELKLPVQKLWDAIRNIEDVAPKINVHSRPKLLKGNGGVGSICLMQFADGRYETERVDVVDEKTHTLKSTVIAQESSRVYNQYTKTMTFCPARDDTTTIARWKAEYAPSADGETAPAGLASTDNILDLFKALESYLTSTPNSSSTPAQEVATGA